jgi:hypothetical protein
MPIVSQPELFDEAITTPNAACLSACFWPLWSGAQIYGCSWFLQENPATFFALQNVEMLAYAYFFRKSNAKSPAYLLS